MDDDVVEGGPRRGNFALAAALGVVALALLALVRFGDSVDEPDPPPVTALPAPSPRASLPWPTAKGACGNYVELPLVSARALRERTGLRVLAGGARLARVDLDSGRTEVLDEQRTSRLVPSGPYVYAVGERGCRPGSVVALRVAASGPPRRVDLAGVEGLLPTEAGLYGVDYRSDSDRVALHLPTGRTVRLAPGANPEGVSAYGVVATVPGEGLTELPAIVLLDPATGELVRRIGRGSLWAVGDRVVVWTGDDCRYWPRPGSSTASCLLRLTALDGDGAEATYRLPEGRMPTSQAVFGGDGRYAAFQLGRAHPEPRYTHQHPFPESDVAVLDLDTADLEVVPGLELPPKCDVGLAFSADARWLVLATDQGDHGDVFVWRRGSADLLRTPVLLTGPPAGGVPVVVTSRGRG